MAPPEEDCPDSKVPAKSTESISRRNSSFATATLRSAQDTAASRGQQDYWACGKEQEVLAGTAFPSLTKGSPQGSFLGSNDVGGPKLNQCSKLDTDENSTSTAAFLFDWFRSTDASSANSLSRISSMSTIASFSLDGLDASASADKNDTKLHANSTEGLSRNSFIIAHDETLIASKDIRNSQNLLVQQMYATSKSAISGPSNDMTLDSTLHGSNKTEILPAATAAAGASIGRASEERQTKLIIRPTDVLGGRGGKINDHNKHFIKMCEEVAEDYARTGKKRKNDDGKEGIASGIVDAIHAERGRFIVKNGDHWQVMPREGKKGSIEKTQRCIRDIVLNKKKDKTKDKDGSDDDKKKKKARDILNKRRKIEQEQQTA